MELKSFFENVVQVHDEAILRQIVKKAEVLRLKRGQFLLSNGEQSDRIYILVKGWLRGYFVSEDGQEVNDRFFWHPGDFIVGSPRLSAASEIDVLAMCPCQVIALPISLVMKLVNSKPEAMCLYNEKLIEAMERHHHEKVVFHYGSAEQRYYCMASLYPEWNDLIPDKYIASYLRMTPVTLSRLRRKFREEKLQMK